MFAYLISLAAILSFHEGLDAIFFFFFFFIKLICWIIFILQDLVTS